MIKSNSVFLGRVDGSRISKDNFRESMKESYPDSLRKGRKYIKSVSADLIKSTIRCKKKGY